MNAQEHTNHHHLYCPYCAFFEVTGVKQRGDIFSWNTPEILQCPLCGQVIDLDGLPRMCNYIRDGFTTTGQKFHQFTITYPPLYCDKCQNVVTNVMIPCPAVKIPIDVFDSELSTWIILRISPIEQVPPNYLVVENHFSSFQYN